MRKTVTIVFSLLLWTTMRAQTNLSVKMEELNAPQFIEAVTKSSKTAIIPIGVIEKHGPHMPLGTDVYTARALAVSAAQREYAVVFPWYNFGQIQEARHQPGTIAYTPELIWKVLEETLDELHRNGFEKIILVNGHGGNTAFLEYFCQSQLSKRRDYVVYWYQTEYNDELVKKAEAMTMHDSLDMHAGNRETSMVKSIVPDLVHPELANTQSGKDLKRLNNLSDVYTGIWWYAGFPNHYSGDGSKAKAEAGQIIVNGVIEHLASVIRKVKEDKNAPALQKQFYDEAEHPVSTKQ